MGERYVKNLVRDAREVVDALHFLGKKVCIVAGGYNIPIRILAAELGIPKKRVVANELYFDAGGNYGGIRPGPCTRTTGKRIVLKKIAKSGTTLFVGDGATDVLCQNAVDCFVGYGGVSRRASVVKKAKNYLFSESLAPIVAMAAGERDAARLQRTRFHGVFKKGMRLLKNPTHVRVNEI